jgi:dimeric dUTPase (all-alpha-NTP-PPase superfamily)
MFTKNQMKLMLQMQHEMNTLIDANWVQNQNPFMLAAALEMGEAIEHYGWKWWKKQTPDMNQVKMEMADIWHFMLSQIYLDLQNCPNDIVINDFLDVPMNERAFNADTCIQDFKLLSDLNLMQLLMGSFTLSIVNVPVFLHLCNRFGLSSEDLFKLYVGKNVLNEFRQHNGYKEGTYIKVWSGKEDNEYLTDIMNNVKLDSENLKDDVYQALRAAYVTYA